MSSLRLILASLVYHWRSGLAVAFGVAVHSSGKSPARPEPPARASTAAPARSVPVMLPSLETPIAPEPIATTRSARKLPSSLRPLPPRRPASPKPSSSAVEPPGPWNPESFGGRR